MYREKENVSWQCKYVRPLTVTISGSRIKGVPRATTVQANAGVGADGVVTSLMLQALVVVDLALVHICTDRIPT